MHQSIYNLKKIEKEINYKKKISIIAVSKTFSMENILPLLEYGHLDFGENKIQEAQFKWEGIKDRFPKVKLHMIGKLQTNKVKLAVKIFDYIHSLDNLKLAKKIKSEQEKINRNLKIFIQVNIGDEKQKSGVSIDELKDFYEYTKNELKINIIGLMCIPPISSDPNSVFSLMKKLKIKFGLNELSMGMSSDYLEAVEKESTFIRIGSKIFGQRN
jgi:pyridoxal phosphate enzyme (YggS family)|tara:strand:- start:184 stop:825 length:642 start_codon:yes stop_codon:yes gene_type:complete